MAANVRLTKIIATLGPASSSPEVVAELIAAGVDVFRLNFSHGSHDEHASRVRTIRECAARAGRHVAILQDLSGPKIRTGKLAEGKPLMLKDGDVLRIATGDFLGEEGRVSTSYAPLAQSVRAGDRLLLDDGRVELRVESSDGTEIVTRVVNGGPLGERKGINAPGVRLPASSLTEKDVADLRFGIAQGVDLVALSFVQTAADLVRAREVARAEGGATLPIIAKIERPEAIEALDEVLDAADGVMVARGDLGLEMPLERVPRVQKEITRGAQARGIPVIVATQVFESMTVEPRPTRAEVSDAANAVDDLVDAIMLSGETAVGAFPVRTVQTLDAVIRDAEAIVPIAGVAVGDRVNDVAHSRALCEAAVTLAHTGGASAVVAVTRQGRTARVLSAFRTDLPVFAITTDQRTARRLVLCRGVVPTLVGPAAGVEPAIASARDELLSRGRLRDGDLVVFVNVSAELARDNANYLRILRVRAGGE
jgi:pyruvate kinase